MAGTAGDAAAAAAKLFAELDRALRQALYEKAQDICTSSKPRSHAAHGVRHTVS